MEMKRPVGRLLWCLGERCWWRELRWYQWLVRRNWIFLYSRKIESLSVANDRLRRIRKRQELRIV